MSDHNHHRVDGAPEATGAEHDLMYPGCPFTVAQLEHGIRATENMHRRSWRISGWMYDRAIAVEPITDENDSTWPTTLRSRAWSAAAALLSVSPSTWVGSSSAWYRAHPRSPTTCGTDSISSANTALPMPGP